MKRRYTQRDHLPNPAKTKPDLDRCQIHPIDSTPKGIEFGAKSIEKSTNKIQIRSKLIRSRDQSLRVQS